MLRHILKEQIKRHEGLRLKLYRCPVGVLTIGYGFNIEDGITKEIAEYLLDKGLELVIKEATEIFPKFAELSDNRRAVICNMLFNLGKTRFLRFKRTIKYIKKGLYYNASVEMLDSDWAKQVGPRAFELARLMRDG